MVFALLAAGCSDDTNQDTASTLESKAATAQTEEQNSGKVQTIEDIEGWEHPTKNVFERYGLQLMKVELSHDQTYPTFYLSTDPRRLLTDPGFQYELAEANGYWDYKIIYDDQFVEIYADKASKLVNKMVTSSETIDMFWREENGNRHNDSYTIRYGNRIIFSDLNGGIYLNELDGSHLITLSDDYAENMSIHANELFYTSNASIYRLNLSSGRQSVLYEGNDDEPIQWMELSHNQLYWVNGKLQVMDLQGGNRATLLKDRIILSPQIVNGDLLYASRDVTTDRFTIQRFDLESREKRVVKQGIDDLYGMQQYEDGIYYLTRTRSPDDGKCTCSIQRMELDGSNNTVLHSFTDNVHSMNVAGDWIYYVRRDSAQYEVIARLSLHNHGQEELLPSSPTYRMLGEWKLIEDPDIFDSPGELNITANWLYYYNVYGHNSYLQALRLPN
ncbi:DUF5050 domain-containing protein [Paenibacillus sp. CCS19]|uniref:DUF5050 domain-containing protein n=1 Tax=Paenibacillus sp. CCS19 TaxID=3158387 RepID=UPI00295E7324|nr:DUF5050 domain-containing protein [Paenibacillus cellulosilyticus]